MEHTSVQENESSLSNRALAKLEDSSLESNNPTNKPARGFRFWVVFFSLFVAVFLICLEATVVSTALPTIAKDLALSQFVWIGSCYALANAAALPLCGGFAQVFGRKPVILGSLILFIIGSAIGGSAHNQSTILAARVIQVSLSERGAFNGILGLAFCIAGGIGPVVGGALAQEGQWRWIFFMNIPIAVFCISIIIFSLHVPTPPGSVSENGNFIIVASTASCSTGLTWGGIEHPWNSPQVLVPLILGLLGTAAFFVYEAFVPTYPLIPYHIFANRTSISGFIQTFILSIPHLSLLYYLPVYYQACKDASPTASGVDLFGLVFSVAPMAMISGLSVNIFKVYRPQIIAGWVILIVGSGALSIVKENSTRSLSLGLQIVNGIGIGLVYMTVYFPILAPLPITSTAQALALYNYLRAIAQTWGVTIGSAVLQNQLKSDLPVGFTDQFPAGVAIAYSIIPIVPGLSQPLKDQVRDAFAKGLATLWQVHTGIIGAGLIACLFMRGLPLHTEVDKNWELEEKAVKSK
ncbi:Efflux pump FUS6 [Psilocybe cubensis]|uniref:Efflux pump FUS6 n=1 Tax=Psilocybe cubensis TaxID=181762 RepID=A0ACB8H0Q4_PSICU|nr:Efflux pump FUS6 [Psilocybe cubensis]KAH9481262.1 Efflux pump FUS6 [Psilocybe cubensis]